MKKVTLIKIFLSSMMVIGQASFAQGIPTYDNVNMINAGLQLAEWAKQIGAMKQAFDQAQQQYNSITGSRGLGKIFNNPTLRNALPPEGKDIYDASVMANYGIKGQVDAIAAAEQVLGSLGAAQKKIAAREALNAQTNKAVAQKALASSADRISQIESLMGQIDATDDPKSVAEINARIAAENSSLTNVNNQLQLIRQLQIAENDLVQQQKNEVKRQLLDNSNTAMPSF